MISPDSKTTPPCVYEKSCRLKWQHAFFVGRSFWSMHDVSIRCGVHEGRRRCMPRRRARDSKVFYYSKVILLTSSIKKQWKNAIVKCRWTDIRFEEHSDYCCITTTIQVLGQAAEHIYPQIALFIDPLISSCRRLQNSSIQHLPSHRHLRVLAG